MEKGCTGFKSVTLKVGNQQQRIDAIAFYTKLGFKVLKDDQEDTRLVLYRESDFEIRLSNEQQTLVFYSDEIKGKQLDPMGNVVEFVGGGSQRPTPKVEVKSNEPAPNKPIQSKPAIVRRLGILTSGGDSCGMNPTIRAITRVALQKGCIPFAIYEGYQGLCDGGDKIKELKWSDVRSLLSKGGTEIGTARCQDFRGRPGRLKACYNMIKNGIDALVVIGGNHL